MKRICKLWLIVMLLSPVAAKASFVENANRIDDSGFPAFFATRMDDWFKKNLSRRQTLSPEENAYVDTFVAHLKSFGTRLPAGYVRQLSYNPDGPFRFLDLEGRHDVHEAALKVLKKREPKFDSKTLPVKMGLGLAPHDADIEIILWQDDLSKSPFAKNKTGAGETILKIKDSKIVGQTIIEIGFHGRETCSAAAVSTQIDRETDGSGAIQYISHVDQFQDLALDSDRHKLYEQVWNGLNLSPGTVTCDRQATTALAYP